MAQWIRHLTTNQGIPGSSPGRVVFFNKGIVFFLISFLSPNMSIFTSFLGLNAKKYIYRFIYYIDSLDRGIFGQNFGSLRYDFILERS